MAATKPIHSIRNTVGKANPALDIEFRGNWNLHHGRRSYRPNRIFFVNSLVLVACLLLLCCALMLLLKVNNTESLTVNTLLIEKIEALESKIAILENSRTEVTRMKGLSERRKRSADCAREAENRGEKKNKSNRTQIIDMRAIQFISSDPSLFALRPLQGVIGPWSEQSADEHKIDSFGLKLVENDRKLEIGRTGTYFIYSQVTYPSKNSANSYSINVISVDDRKNTPISICSTAGKQVSDNEVSCYTSTLRSLRSGDIIYFQQMEQNRDINLDVSSTYFGMILLNE